MEVWLFKCGKGKLVTQEENWLFTYVEGWLFTWVEGQGWLFAQFSFQNSTCSGLWTDLIPSFSLMWLGDEVLWSFRSSTINKVRGWKYVQQPFQVITSLIWLFLTFHFWFVPFFLYLVSLNLVHHNWGLSGRLNYLKLTLMPLSRLFKSLGLSAIFVQGLLPYNPWKVEMCISTVHLAAKILSQYWHCQRMLVLISLKCNWAKEIYHSLCPPTYAQAQ